MHLKQVCDILVSACVWDFFTNDVNSSLRFTILQLAHIRFTALLTFITTFYYIYIYEYTDENMNLCGIHRERFFIFQLLQLFFLMTESGRGEKLSSLPDFSIFESHQPIQKFKLFDFFRVFKRQHYNGKHTSLSLSLSLSTYSKYRSMTNINSKHTNNSTGSSRKDREDRANDRILRGGLEYSIG